MTKIIIGATLAALLSASAPTLAQDTSTVQTPAAGTASPVPGQSAPEAVPTANAKVAIPRNVFYRGFGPQQYAAKDKLIGANVMNAEGVVIGDIKDLIMSSSNQVEGVLLGTGGILGAGEKEVGVRYGALQFSRKDGKLTISLPQASKDVIAALEPFNHGPRKSLAEKAADKFQALKDKTAAGAGPAYEQAKAAAAPYLEKAKAATSAAVDKAKELGKEAMEKAKEATTSAPSTAPAPTAPAAPATDAPKQ